MAENAEEMSSLRLQLDSLNVEHKAVLAELSSVKAQLAVRTLQ
jgi:hypothetical protein